MKVYMYVTADKYELPLAVADSVVELARMTGKSESTIHSAIYHATTPNPKYNKFNKTRYVRVEIEGD